MSRLSCNKPGEKSKIKGVGKRFLRFRFWFSSGFEK